MLKLKLGTYQLCDFNNSLFDFLLLVVVVVVQLLSCVRLFATL